MHDVRHHFPRAHDSPPCSPVPPEIATITYRSGPEWDLRFGRKLRQLPDGAAQRPDRARTPALCPDFQIETYLDHQGEEFCLKYDANSLIYISKAMDLFDLTAPALAELRLAPPAPRAVGRTVSRVFAPDGGAAHGATTSAWGHNAFTDVGNTEGRDALPAARKRGAGARSPSPPRKRGRAK